MNAIDESHSLFSKAAQCLTDNSPLVKRFSKPVYSTNAPMHS